MNQDNQVRVWDPFIRIFHWLLVVAFFTAYITEGEPEWLHVWAGYLIVGLLVLRIIWGFIGSEHARFSSFVFSPGTILAYLRDNIRGRAEYYRGHNPAGGAMIL
ncbi:MAG: cytochrome b/b6 domain-containing protein, partial [Pseudomonadota bacterium]